jgi:photosystem II stability/assembly factor-like uncharacterized protein
MTDRLRLRFLLAATVFLTVATATTPAPTPAQAVDPGLYAGMEYRMVGPFRGGRTTAVTGVPGSSHLFYTGYTGGGLWESTDAGHYWTPITDGQLEAGAIGAVTVAPSDANVIYLGTGSVCIRGNISTGRGLYRSEDRGRTWDFIGLPESGAIGSIVVHPDDPDLVYVAALGHIFGKNEERGIFRSTDGGATWEGVLVLNDSTGASDLVMDPSNPRVLYAGMWRAERKPWTLISGAEEGGVYKSVDGGDSWTRLENGLPEGKIGKVGLAVSPADPDRVWAMVEANPGNGLYRSDDGGESWRLLTQDNNIVGRPFYYHHVIADPQDPNTVYSANVRLWRSVDGGENWDMIPVPHGDVHDVWINPDHPEIFVAATDGGASVTLNDGATFSGVYNQPTAEFYDVMVDNQRPYRIYGSQQDNTTISVPVEPRANALRPQEGWRYAAGCETGPIAFDPDDPDVIWGGCYGGIINRMVLSEDRRRNVNLYPESQDVPPSELRYRFQWVAPIVMSPHDSDVVYHASQYVHRTSDGGMTWETISPDLTTDTPEHQGFPGEPLTTDHSGVEVFNTIFALVPSPHVPGTIWVGTDDGRVHITRDDGGSWTEITPRRMPELATVNRIEVSPHRAGRAFLAVQRYRLDDWRPYIYRTDDFGESWELLTDGRNGIPDDYWVRVVREDPAVEGLLYAGTEFGVFVSFDDGRRWQPLQTNLPATPITDLQVQARRGDLVVATQGRSFWVLDDLTPLRELAAEPDVSGARLFTPRDVARGDGYPPLNEVDLTFPDRLPMGALLHYAIAADAGASAGGPDAALPGLRMEVLDADDRVLARWAPDRRWPEDTGSEEAGDDPGAGTSSHPEVRVGDLPAAPGFHRVVWSMSYPGPGGVKAPPGAYRVRLAWEGGEQTRSFRITPDPKNSAITLADYTAQFETSMALSDTMAAMDDAAHRIASVREQARALLERVEAADRDAGALPALVDSLMSRLDALERELEGYDTSEGRPGRRSIDGLDDHYGRLMYQMNSRGGYGGGSTEGPPTAGMLERKADLDARWSELRTRIETVLDEDVAAVNAEVERLGVEGILVP